MAKNNCPCGNPMCVKHIVCRFIRRKGKIIYPKNGNFFSFCIENKEKTASSLQEMTV